MQMNIMHYHVFFRTIAIFFIMFFNNLSKTKTKYNPSSKITFDSIIDWLFHENYIVNVFLIVYAYEGDDNICEVVCKIADIEIIHFTFFYANSITDKKFYIYPI